MCCTKAYKWLDDAFELWASGEGDGWSIRRIATYSRKIGQPISRDSIDKHLKLHRPDLWARIEEVLKSLDDVGRGT
jgi:hypothetical protein